MTKKNRKSDFLFIYFYLFTFDDVASSDVRDAME